MNRRRPIPLLQADVLDTVATLGAATLGEVEEHTGRPRHVVRSALWRYARAGFLASTGGQVATYRLTAVGEAMVGQARALGLVPGAATEVA